MAALASSKVRKNSRPMSASISRVPPPTSRPVSARGDRDSEPSSSLGVPLTNYDDDDADDGSHTRLMMKSCSRNIDGSDFE